MNLNCIWKESWKAEGKYETIQQLDLRTDGLFASCFCLLLEQLWSIGTYHQWAICGSKSDPKDPFEFQIIEDRHMY